MSNPVIQVIDLDGAQGNAAGYITCQTNAGFTQQGIVTVTDASGNTVASGTFQGKGEGGIPTQLISGGTLLSFQGAKLPLTLNATFNYDPNGSFTPNDPSKVIATTQLDTQQLESIIIKSEDGVDADYNDLIMTVIVIRH